MEKPLLRKCLSVCVISISCGSFICSAGAQAQTERASGEKSGAQEKSRSLAPLGMTNLEPGMTALQRQDGGVNPPLQSVPRLIKYSGTLKDSKGAPKSGAAGVTFAIYAEQEGGAPLWMETQNVTFDEGGRFTALLGANSSEGVPAELFTNQWRVASGEWREKDNAETQSSPRSAEQAGQEAEGTMYRAPTNSARVAGQERWLGVEGPDIQETPRVLLVSVPYALKAADAETLGGMPASAFVLASPQTGGTATTTEKGTQAGVPVLLKPRTATTTTTTSTGNANLLAKYDSTSNLVPSAIFESNGNVGIGTTNPLAPFHVNGNTLLVQSGTTAQAQLTGAASSGRFGQDSNGTFLASDTKGSSLRFLTNNGGLNEWMRIGSAGSVNIGSAQAAQLGEAVLAPDNLDTVHSVIGQAGSQYHFRLSRAIPDDRGARHFLITPYKYGTAIEYPGVVEFWNQEFSVHNHPSLPGRGAFFWVGDEIDSGGLFVTAMNNSGGASSTVTLAADRFNHTSHGSLNFVVRNTTDAFRFDMGPFGSEVMAAQISGTGAASNVDLYNGPVQATLRAQNGTTVDAEIGSTSNHPLSLFANNGAARATLFPSGNFSIGNSLDTAPLAVGTAAQFQVSPAGAVTIGGGTPIKQHLSVTVSLAFPQFAPGSCNLLSFAVGGAVDGDTVALGMPNSLASINGLTWFGWVSGPGAVSIRSCNATTNALPAPPAANVRVDIWQH